MFRWRSPAGDTLDAQLFLPPEGVRPFPLVVVPYGGYANEFPKAGYFLTQGVQPLVSRGYAVVLPNTRGIASGAQTDGRYGATQLEDTHALLDALAGAGVADTSRVAVVGHSHGATMAYYYVSHSRRFRAAVAINGAADWVVQAGLQTMVGLPGGMGGTPEEVPEAYRAASPLANARSVVAPVLAVAGRTDTQIPPSNAEAMTAALQSLGGDATLRVFEDEGHLIERPDNQRAFWSAVFAFLDRTIGPGDGR